MSDPNQEIEAVLQRKVTVNPDSGFNSESDYIANENRNKLTSYLTNTQIADDAVLDQKISTVSGGNVIGSLPEEIADNAVLDQKIPTTDRAIDSLGSGKQQTLLEYLHLKFVVFVGCATDPYHCFDSNNES